EDLLRAKAKDFRGTISRLLRCRSSPIVFGLERNQSEQLFAPAETAFDELGFAMDEREKIPDQQIAGSTDRSQRRAWPARAKRRSTTGFSRRILRHDAGDELSLHRKVQTHEVTPPVKKKLKVLVLFDGVRPTPIDADLTEELK